VGPVGTATAPPGTVPEPAPPATAPAADGLPAIVYGTTGRTPIEGPPSRLDRRTGRVTPLLTEADVPGFRLSPSGIDVSPDGRLAVVLLTRPGSPDGHAFLIDLEGPPAPRPLSTGPEPVNAARFSPDGRTGRPYTDEFGARATLERA
jgi:hypothetical protein